MGGNGLPPAPAADRFSIGFLPLDPIYSLASPASNGPAGPKSAILPPGAQMS
jgi:hypothetical protein